MHVPPSDEGRPADPPAPDVDLDELLGRHLPGLRAFLSRRAGEFVRSRESSQDLAQSVCREVLEHAGRFRHGGEDGFRQWLYRTAERKLVDRARRYSAARRDVRREESAVAEDLSGLFATPSHDAIVREDLERARAAFDALPETTRRVIVLSRLDGLTSAQIAEMLGSKEGTVRSLLCRGLAAISEALDRVDGHAS
jgi:RNA polymerase sigma factor (sigma-70 family)